MSKQLNEVLGSCDFENLINGNYPPCDVFGVTVAAGYGELKRGDVLALDTAAGAGKMTKLGRFSGTVKQTVDIIGGAATIAELGLDTSSVEVWTTSAKTTKCTLTTDYTVAYASGTLTITVVDSAALDAATSCYVEVAHTSTAAGAANCILAEDVDTGSDTAAAGLTAQAYRTGNFNRGALGVTTGYVMTLTDEENLRKGGILLNTSI